MKLTAIHNLYQKDCHFDGKDYYVDGKKLTKKQEKEVAKEVARLEAEIKANEYKIERSRKYPSIQEQLDMMYHDAKNGTTTWIDAIDAVKAQHPKTK